jgi:hypothetical protein
MEVDFSKDSYISLLLLIMFITFRISAQVHVQRLVTATSVVNALLQVERVFQHVLLTIIHSLTQPVATVFLNVSMAVSEELIATFATTTTVPVVPILMMTHVQPATIKLLWRQANVVVLLLIGKMVSSKERTFSNLAALTTVLHAQNHSTIFIVQNVSRVNTSNQQYLVRASLLALMLVHLDMSLIPLPLSVQAS